MQATPEELLAVIEGLYPEQYGRAVAELTIRKQQERIRDLEDQLARASHSHPDETVG